MLNSETTHCAPQERRHRQQQRKGSLDLQGEWQTGQESGQRCQDLCEPPQAQTLPHGRPAGSSNVFERRCRQNDRQHDQIRTQIGEEPPHQFRCRTASFVELSA